MGDVDDRWTRTVRDGTGHAIGREHTDRWGRGLRYAARWRDPNGRQRTKSFATVRDARAWLAQTEVDLSRGAYVDPSAGRITLNEWVDTWLSQQVTNISTQHQQKLRLRVHVLPALGSYQLRAITPAVIKPWLADLSSRLSASYVRAIYGVLVAVLAAAVDDGRIAKSPCSAASVRPPARQIHKVTPWPAQWVADVHDAMPDRYAEMVTCAAGLGLRHGEIRGLAVTAIDWLRREVSVRQQVKALRGKLFLDLPKRGKERMVPMSDQVALRLSAHVASFPPVEVTLPWGSPTGRPVSTRLLFTSGNDRAIHQQTYTNSAWHPALRAVGIPTQRVNGMHALRHFFASAVLAGGASIRDLADWLGHEDPGFTLRTYAHLMPSSSDRMRTAVDSMFLGNSVDTETVGM